MAEHLKAKHKEDTWEKTHRHRSRLQLCSETLVCEMIQVWDGLLWEIIVGLD